MFYVILQKEFHFCPTVKQVVNKQFLNSIEEKISFRPHAYRHNPSKAQNFIQWASIHLYDATSLVTFWRANGHRYGQLSGKRKMKQSKVINKV